MKSYFLILSCLGATCITLTMHHNNPLLRPRSKSIDYISRTIKQYPCPKESINKKSTISDKEKKLHLKEQKLNVQKEKLEMDRVRMCSEFLRTYNGEPIIMTTEQTRINCTLYLQAWAFNLPIQ